METIEFHGYQTTPQQIEECVRLVDICIDQLDASALNELLGGYENDIQLLIDSMVKDSFMMLYQGQVGIKSDNLVVLEHISKAMEEAARFQDINYFVNDVFGSEIDINWHHIEWGNLANTRDFIACLASRDHGKSFFWSRLYPIWMMYKYNPNDPLQVKKNKGSGFLISHTEPKAIDYLEGIKETISSNAILNNRLAIHTKAGWSKREIKTANGCSLKVRGFGSNIRGYHPAWIVVDDPLHDNNIYSPAIREKSINFFHSVIMNMLVPEGQIICVGTPFHELDLYHTFRKPEARKIWAYREYPALFPNGDVLWSDRYSFDALMTKRATQGNMIFSREFLCRPIVSESSIFPWSILKKATNGMQGYKMVNNLQAHPIKFERVVAGCDFAISANVGADYTVFTVWGIDEEGCMWLLYAFRKQGATFNEQIGQIKTIWANFHPDIIILENNNFQGIYDQFLQSTDIPIKPHTTGANKHLKHGLPSLAVMFERGKIKLPYGDERSRNFVDLLMTEFNNITFTDKGLESVGGHDDTVMSTWFGRIGAITGVEANFDYQFM